MANPKSKTGNRKSKDLYRLLFEAASEAMLVVEAGQVAESNASALTLFGCKRKELLGQTLVAFASPDQLDDRASAEAWSEKVEAVLAGEPQQFEWLAQRLNGQTFYAEVRLQAVEMGDRTLLQVSMQDITGRKQLERQIQESLERRSRQVQTSTEVAQEIAAAPALDELFRRVVDLVQTRFDYYHAHVYTLEEENLVMQEGTGEAGRQMKKAGHQIALTTEQSLVARVARSGQPVLVPDVSQEPGWLPNPLLPETKAELALPVKLGDEILGVLDVQSDTLGGLSEEDQLLLAGLCGQIAVAIDSRRAEAERKQAEAALAKRVSELNCLNAVGREIAETPPVPELLQWVTERIPPAMQYPDLCRVAIEYDGQVYGQPEAIELPCHVANALRAGGQVMGRVYIAYTEKREFLDEESALLGGIATRLGGYIENRRLVEQTQQRAAALEEATRFLDSIVENIPSGLVVKDAEELKFVEWNKANEALTGLKKEEVVGKTDYNFFPKDEADFFTGQDREVLAGGKLVDIPEEPIHTAYEGLRLLHTRKVPILGADGQPKYLLSISEDITEHKQAEAALRESEAQLAEALDIARLAYWEFDVETQMFTFNDQIYSLYGTTAEQAGGYQMSAAEFAQKFVHPDEAANVGIQIQGAIETTDPNYTTQFESRMRRPDGQESYIAVQLRVVKDERGRTVKMYGTNQDVTERKQAEAALAKRVSELNCLNAVGREIAETPPVPELLQWVTERIPPAMQYPDLCRVAIEYDGQVYGQPEAIELPCHVANALRAGGQVMGRVYIAYTEKREFLDEESALLGGIATRLGGYIENRRLVEQTQQRAAELEETTGFLNSILANIPSGIFVKDAQELRFVEWNKASEEVTGLKQTEVIGKNDYDFFPQEEADFFTAKDREVLNKGEMLDIPEEPIHTADKGTRLLHTRKIPLLGPDGKPRYLLGILEDITERKAAEAERERLLADLSRLSAVIENTSDFVGVATLDGQVMYVNPAGMAMVGRAGEDYTGLSLPDFQGAKGSKQMMKEAFPTAMGEGTWTGESTFQHVDGSLIPVSQVVMVIRNEAGEPVSMATNARDISDQKEAEVERERLLSEVQRLATIVENHPDFIGVGTLDGKALYVNPSGLTMMGLPPDHDVTGMDASNFYPPADAEMLVKEGVPAALEKGFWSSEANLLKVDGTTLPVEQVIGINYDTEGNPYSFSITMHDISNRKEAEVERERLLAEVQAAYRQFVRREWEQFLGEQHQGRWRIEQQGPGSSGAAEPGSNGAEEQSQIPNPKSQIEMPITLRGQAIGSLSLEDIDPDRTWTAEEKALIESVSEQLALTVENLRLFEDTRQSAVREQLTREITDKLRAAPDVDSIINTGLTELAKALGVSRTYVKLTTAKLAQTEAKTTDIEAIRRQLKPNGRKQTG